MKTYTIDVIGGTGKSGQYLVQNLLEKGYSLRLLLRYPENFTLQNPSIEIVQGDARDEKAIHKLIEGSDLVISALGQPKGDKSIFSDAAKNIISAMKHYDLNRYYRS